MSLSASPHRRERDFVVVLFAVVFVVDFVASFIIVSC
jgi:hypothetical protein